jgi:putative radical SAM enzyme (TIGR03279 family)
MVRVKAVGPGGLGAELGITPGTELLAINGRPLEDFLDWEFLSADEAFVLLARHPGGETVEYDIERPDDLPFGLELDPPHIRRCANRCDFCFVDGLPEGLRGNLYIRDDDYRLSFRYGNFATLTNLKPRDIARILEYRLSPLYVSVHVTDTVLRRRYLRNPRAPDVLEQLRTFAAAGIRFHTQIVLQPGVNDGAVLERSLADLWSLGDCVLSVSVVPVGLTDHSKLALVREPTRDECRAAIGIVHQCAERAEVERGHRWVHGSDDLYLVAEEPLPPASWYGDFEQVENGVGSVRYLQLRIAASAAALPRLDGRRIAVLTGTAMGRLMGQVTAPLVQRTGAAFEVVPIVNPLFGPSVTTAALLPGRAFQSALAGRGDLTLALLPAEAVNDDGRFMDDLTVGELMRSVPCEVRLSHDFGDALSEAAPP